MAVLCAVAGYVGAEQGRQVEGKLGSAGRLGEMRGPVGIGRGATYPFPLDAWLWLWLHRMGPSPKHLGGF